MEGKGRRGKGERDEKGKGGGKGPSPPEKNPGTATVVTIPLSYNLHTFGNLAFSCRHVQLIFFCSCSCYYSWRVEKSVVVGLLSPRMLYDNHFATPPKYMIIAHFL